MAFKKIIVDPINWKDLIAHIESGQGNKQQLRLIFAVITKALKEKQQLQDEFIEYISRVNERFSKQKNNLSLDQAFVDGGYSRSTKKQPAKFGGDLPNTVAMVFREMLAGVGKDSAIEVVASELKCSASKVRKDINFYIQDYFSQLVVEKKIRGEKLTSKEMNVIKNLI